MRLSKRLETIVKQAALVCGGEAAADVGTDHGFVPIRLFTGTMQDKSAAAFQIARFETLKKS